MSQKVPRIYLVAGEASGDLIGGSLMKAIKDKTSGQVEFAGIGGTYMQNQGFSSIFPMKELSILGIVEIIPHIPNVLTRLAQTVQHIKAWQPDVVVTLDSPGFNFRLAKKLKGLGTPLIHYTAPTVWAWRPWRAKKVARLYQHLLTLFGFEPPYFEAHGLASTFVGHPLVEKNIDQLNPLAFRQSYNIAPEDLLLCILPGSRQGELKTLLPIFQQTLKQLKAKIPNLKVVVPTLPHLTDQINEAFPEAIIVTDEQAKYQAMRACTLALAASGTVTLELAIAQTPMVVAYKINKLTEWIVRSMLLTKDVALPNILAGKQIVPECLQDECNPDVLTEQCLQLLTNDNLNQVQRHKLKEIQKLLVGKSGMPSEAAAEVILKYCS